MIATAESEIVVARARKGDPEAVENLFRTYSPTAFTMARRICRSHEDAEDVVQETFLEVAKSIRSFRGEGSLEGWIRKIAASKALMKLRSRRSRGTEEPFDDEVQPMTPSAPPHHERLDLEAALSRLPDASRAVVWLHDVAGYTHDEIAALTGMTVSYSKSKLARAHALLKEHLEG